jgi:hypothetical protein
MNQCLRAAEAMFDMHFSPPVLPMLKRKSFGDINEQTPKRQAIMSPMVDQQHPQARSFGAHNTASIQPISIQPRPSPNGHPAPSPSISSPPVSATPPNVMPPRKRGRPSKATREVWARNKASQPGGYAPISPAPIAPSAAQSIPQQTYSPSPGATPVYQVSPGSAPEIRPKKQTRTQAADKKQQTEDIPRSVQGSPETMDQNPPRTGFDYGWRDNPRGVDQKQAGGNLGPVPLEPPIQSQRPRGNHPIQIPHSPVVTAAIPRTTVADPALEHARVDGLPRVTNQA